MKDFYEVLQFGLQEKLGPVLFQLPPKMEYNPELLEAIISHTDPAFTNVIEFRNKTWWNREVMDILGENNITFCGVSFPALPDEAVVNTPAVYYRFHGVPKLYFSPYNEDFLLKIVKKIKRNKEVKNAYLFFNNTISAAALDNAKFVQEQLS